MYLIYLNLLKTIYKYRAMIFYSNYSTADTYQITVGIKNESCTIYIQKDCRFTHSDITVFYHNSDTSREYHLEPSELLEFLDMHLIRKEERQTAVA